MAFLKQQKQNRDWAGGLPGNITDDILDRLVDLSDYIRFASVCMRWRSLALDDRNHRGKKNKVRTLDNCTQIPMLMVASLSNDDDGRAELYSPSRQKILNFHLSFPYKTYTNIIGSSFGWLINVDRDAGLPSAGATLFNPFSASIIRLPPLLFNRRKRIRDHFNKQTHIMKATLSKDPALYPDEYVVLMISGKASKLSYTKQGGSAPGWCILQGRGGFCDVIYSKSSGLFFGLLGTGEVCSIDITRVGGGLDCFTPALQIREGGDDDLRYIVETPSGDLLQVYRLLSGSFRTLKIKVFKFLKTSCSWSELKNLGDNALFVGDATSMCLSASDFPGCRAGSVYYSLPYRKYFATALRKYKDLMFTAKLFGQLSGQDRFHYDIAKLFEQDWVHYDLGVADINTERVESFTFKYPTSRYSLLDAALQRPPIWVVPTFQDRPRKEEDIVSTFLKRPRKEEDIVPTILKRPRKEGDIVPTTLKGPRKEKGGGYCSNISRPA